MKSKFLLSLFSTLFFVSCNTANADPSSSFSSSEKHSFTSSETVSSSSSEESSSQKESSSKPSSSPIEIEDEYNPNGSKKIAPPQNKDNKLDIEDYTTVSFFDSMPENFKFIYGNNTTKGDFYASAANGGLKMNEDGPAKKGFQSCMFNSFVKVELRFHIGNFFNNSKKVNKNDPVFTIYGFDENGKYLLTETVDMIDKNDIGNYVRVYIRNIQMAYFELRVTNLPYKSSQVYNFSITELTLKGWDYE